MTAACAAAMGGFLSILYLVVLGQERQYLCHTRLDRIGAGLHTYAREDRTGCLPELSRAGLMPLNAPNARGKRLYPDYIANPAVLMCPADPHGQTVEQDALPYSSHFYLGYVIQDDAQMEAFAAAYKEQLAKGLPFREDLPAEKGAGSKGGDSFCRLRIDVDRPLNPKVLKGVPFLIERPGHHKEAGGHVAFMDGEIWWLPYPGRWPMTEKTMKILADMEALAAATSPPARSAQHPE